MLQEFKKIRNIIERGKDLSNDMKQQYGKIFDIIATREKAIMKTEEVARINHEAYKLANDFGMHYETNFSNLLKYDA